ncbi:PEP-CTERM sorting domain-containing protein [Granulicella sp. dw_53]|uniref:PEP-CTERM sorting domain-containing protein n=1 Tax=Granulicella sp. dw_53 TaxID=2719792 RepID=UPI001BD1EB13|nr:PEP-CTERM sorting domain-containing protein [Granulicella sp. dw_53]
MKLRNLFLSAVCIVAALEFTANASAEVIDSFSGTIGTGTSQTGRLSRDGIISDWSSSKTFPGEINTSTTYYYSTYSYTSTDLLSASYIQIDMDSTSANTFISAYLNSYDPTNKSLNYLGDEGQSGNFFGVDTVSFQIVVPANGTLVLVLNTTAGGTTGSADPFTITVEAFANTDFDDPAPTSVPEPATFVLLGSGLVGMAGAVRRRMSKT